MKFEKIANRILAVFLLCVFVVPVILMNHQSGKISTAENRRLADFPKIYDTSGKLNPNLQSEFSSWFGDNLGMRDDYIKLSSNIQYKVLNNSPSQRVEIGRDGWLFYADNITKVTNPNLDEDMLADICDQQIKISNKLKEQGIDYVLVLPASKVSIYPEYIASGDYSVTKTPSDILADYIETHSDVKVIKLKDTLLKAKDSGQLYFNTDSHWNEYGAYIAYCEIVRKLNDWGLLDTSPVEVTFSTTTHHTNLVNMLGDNQMLPDEVCPKSTIINPKAQEITLGEKYNSFQNFVKQTGTNFQSNCATFENSSINSPRILMYGDSMIGGGWNIKEMLAENTSEFTYIWDYRINQDHINFFKPNIVLYEMTEQNIDILQLKNLKFTQNSLSDFSSKIESYEFKNGNLYVTVRNTSKSVWKRFDQVKLGLFKNGSLANRALMPADVEIAPKGKYTFVFEDIDPNELVTNKFEVTMMQEGVRYFGDKATIVSRKADSLKNNAEITSTDILKRQTADGSKDIHVTVKNTGTTAWRKATNDRLVIWTNGSDKTKKVELPDDVTVMPGEKYTFTLKNFAVPQDRNIYYEFQMVQEGVEYFGEKERVDIAVDSSS